MTQPTGNPSEAIAADFDPALRTSEPSLDEHGGAPQDVIGLLNGALATELVGVMRCRGQSFLARGLEAAALADVLMAHADQKLAEADRIAISIVDLHGKPDFNPGGLVQRSHTDYIEADTLVEMIQEDFVAEQDAISSYRDMIASMSDQDSAPRQVLIAALAVEEAHAADLTRLLAEYTPTTTPGDVPGSREAAIDGPVDDAAPDEAPIEPLEPTPPRAAGGDDSSPVHGGRLR